MNISIHTTARWWLRPVLRRCRQYRFQSTPPQGGDKPRRSIDICFWHFNPHHRKVVTSCFPDDGQELKISIHTTARWWHSRVVRPVYHRLFQSTPPQGGDTLGKRGLYEQTYFNPHHRKVVTMLTPEFIKRITISIHTTARWWPNLNCTGTLAEWFQSTPPQGGDRTCSMFWSHNANFNPHHRKVVTIPWLLSVQYHMISIHTTARWWLCKVCDSRVDAGISIHTTARWWPTAPTSFPFFTLFQSTPPQGGDPVWTVNKLP